MCAAPLVDPQPPAHYDAPVSFFRRLRRVRSRPIRDEVWEWTVREHRIFRGLDDGELTRLRSLAEGFLGSKQLEPVRSAEVTEELAASIASQACLPILNRGLEWYEGWSTIIITPGEFEFEQTEYDDAGVAHDVSDVVGGEVTQLGSVILSAADVDASGWGDGYNVVIHEMAHALDRRDGEMNGAPPLPPGMDTSEWSTVFATAFRNLANRVEAGQGRRSLLMDEYALEAPEEFFAVAAEMFFEVPARLDRGFPRVYEVLARFYDQDPGKRTPAGRGARRDR
jgi:MtfA peptidase